MKLFTFHKVKNLLQHQNTLSQNFIGLIISIEKMQKNLREDISDVGLDDPDFKKDLSLYLIELEAITNDTKQKYLDKITQKIEEL